MTKTYFTKYKQFTVVRFNIGNLATHMTDYKLYVERGYHTTKCRRMSSIEFQDCKKPVKWCNVKKQAQRYNYIM